VKLNYQLPLSIEDIRLIPYIMPYTELPNEKEIDTNDFQFGLWASLSIGPIVNW